MQVLTIQCRACSAEFVESRASLEPGDEALCPSCGTRHEFSREFIDTIRNADDGMRDGGSVMHVEPEFKNR